MQQPRLAGPVTYRWATDPSSQGASARPTSRHRTSAVRAAMGAAAAVTSVSLAQSGSSFAVPAVIASVGLAAAATFELAVASLRDGLLRRLPALEVSFDVPFDSYALRRTSSLRIEVRSGAQVAAVLASTAAGDELLVYGRPESAPASAQLGAAIGAAMTELARDARWHLPERWERAHRARQGLASVRGLRAPREAQYSN